MVLCRSTNEQWRRLHGCTYVLPALQAFGWRSCKGAAVTCVQKASERWDWSVAWCVYIILSWSVYPSYPIATPKARPYRFLNAALVMERAMGILSVPIAPLSLHWVLLLISVRFSGCHLVWSFCPMWPSQPEQACLWLPLEVIIVL